MNRKLNKNEWVGLHILAWYVLLFFAFKGHDVKGYFGGMAIADFIDGLYCGWK